MTSQETKGDLLRYLVLMAVLRRPQPKHVLPACPDLLPSEGVELTTDIHAGWHALAPGRWSLDLGRSGRFKNVAHKWQPHGVRSGVRMRVV